MRGVALVLVTLGVVVLLYAGHELYGTGVASDRAQQTASRLLEQEWATPTGVVPTADDAPRHGEPVARIRIPALGPDWSYTVREGTDEDVLADGPGHYTGTALPGEAGNVAIAAHRVGHGAPFDGLGTLAGCEEVVLETRDRWLVYRVLPDAATACAGVAAPSGPYAGLVGREVVPPTRTDVIAAVPGRPDLVPDEPAHLLTLTTCHPRFSARERLVIHAALAEGAQVRAGTAATRRPRRRGRGRSRSGRRRPRARDGRRRRRGGGQPARPG
ncbi:MAG: srtB [Actinomycetospora sp.]|nr:srtB [Actinomycetospora sp.]